MFNKHMCACNLRLLYMKMVTTLSNAERIKKTNCRDAICVNMQPTVSTNASIRNTVCLRCIIQLRIMPQLSEPHATDHDSTPYSQ